MLKTSVLNQHTWFNFSSFSGGLNDSFFGSFLSYLFLSDSSSVSCRLDDSFFGSFLSGLFLSITSRFSGSLNDSFFGSFLSGWFLSGSSRFSRSLNDSFFGGTWRRTWRRFWRRWIRIAFDWFSFFFGFIFLTQFSFNYLNDEFKSIQRQIKPFNLIHRIK